MNPVDALIHLANFLVAPLALGSVAASLAKLVWWRVLRSTAWWRLASAAAAGAAAAAVIGLVVSGRDGAMSTYGGMVLASALALWWVAFGRLRH